MRRLNISHAANQDSKAVVDYLLENDPAAAERFLNRLDETYSEIQRLPNSGMHLRIELPRLPGVLWRRVTKFPNHLVFYRYDDAEVQVLRVLHTAQDWTGFLEG